MAQWGLVVDISKCNACYCCFTACKDEYWDNDYPPYSVAQPRHGQFWMNIAKNDRGKHPYVKVDYIIEDIKVKIDIVLYFDLELEFIKKNGPITAVDRSPWHGYFIRNNLDFNQRNDVRLLKQFFKSCYSYGDKSAVGKGGFIGYSSELLIYYYGNLLNLFENFNNLPKTPLDYYNRNIEWQT